MPGVPLLPKFLRECDKARCAQIVGAAAASIQQDLGGGAGGQQVGTPPWWVSDAAARVAGGADAERTLQHSLQQQFALSADEAHSTLAWIASAGAPSLPEMDGPAPSPSPQLTDSALSYPRSSSQGGSFFEMRVPPLEGGGTHGDDGGGGAAGGGRARTVSRVKEEDALDEEEDRDGDPRERNGRGLSFCSDDEEQGGFPESPGFEDDIIGDLEI